MWAVAAIAFIGLGQLYFHLQLPVLDGVLFDVLGLFAFWRALVGATPPVPLDVAQHTEARSFGQRRWVYATLLLAGALLGLALGAVVISAPAFTPHLPILGVGAAWVTLGMQLDGGFKDSLRALRSSLRAVSRRDALLLAGLLLLAAFLRLYQLAELPQGLWYDEANIGLEGRRILTDPNFRPLYAQSTTSPAAYVYLVAGAEALLGSTVLAVRLVPALAGVLTTAVAYAVGRGLFGPWAGLCAAALFAVSRWDVTFSRVGMQGATTPLLTLLSCALALAALRSGRATAYAMLGVSLGALFWFYSANLLFPLVLLVALGALIAPAGSLLRAQRRGLALALGGLLLVAAPVLLDTWMRPELVFNRPQNASVFKDKAPSEAAQAIGESTVKHLQMFHIQGDANGRHNLPAAPMLDWATAVLMLLGLTVALKRWLDPRSALLLSWLLVMMLPGVLSVEFEAPQGLRSIGALPAALLLATVGAHQARALLTPYLPPGRWGSAAALVGLGLVTALNAGTYFGPQAEDLATWSSYSMAESIVGRRLAETQDRGDRALVSVFYQRHPTVAFLSAADYETFDPSAHLPLRQEADTALFLAPQEEATYLVLRSYYPEADCREERRRPTEAVVLYTCRVSAEIVRAAQGLIAGHSDVDGEPARPPRGDAPAPGAASELHVTGEPPHLAAVNGSLLAPVFGRYRFLLEGPPTWDVSLDGRNLLSGGDAPVDTVLAQGLHDLRLVGAAGSDVAAPPRLLWQPPGGGWEVIPKEALFHASLRPQGLTGSYYRGYTWSALPAFRRIDAAPSVYFHVPPLERPFSVEWSGSVYAGAGGSYRFFLETISYALLEIDGRKVVESREHNVKKMGELYLEPGWHEIRVRHQAADPYAHIFLHWLPPEGRLQLLPPHVLRPW